MLRQPPTDSQQLLPPEGVLLDDYGDRVHVQNIRGQLREIRRLGLSHVPPNKYSAIILDAFYRFLPPGTDENDNAAMAAIYNYLDSCADRLGCCFVLIHHTSQGQSIRQGGHRRRRWGGQPIQGDRCASDP